MNDRHKYRVAVKQGLEWLIYDVINILYKPDGTIWVQVSRKTETAIFTAWFQVDGENTILEQCTGLHDKNGKLIYEGDFVKIAYRDQALHYCVRYDQANCQLYLSCGEREFSESFDVLDNWAIEIIGNIHEMEGEK